jgi:hypothetical protein
MSLATRLNALITAIAADIKALQTAVSGSSVPSVSGNARKVLKTNGTTTSWDFPATQSSTGGQVPTTTQLGLGEYLINTYDGKTYFKKSVGGVETVLVLTGQNPLGSASPMWTTDSSLMWNP